MPIDSSIIIIIIIDIQSTWQHTVPDMIMDDRFSTQANEFWACPVIGPKPQNHRKLLSRWFTVNAITPRNAYTCNLYSWNLLSTGSGVTLWQQCTIAGQSPCSRGRKRAAWRLQIFCWNHVPQSYFTVLPCFHIDHIGISLPCWMLEDTSQYSQ